MKVVAGLGNPGPEYRRTPHNVGFETVELLAGDLGTDWKDVSRFQARVARVERGAGAPWMLVQPQTFMNLSGVCVAPILRYHGGSPQDLAVVVDDADLPPGRLRLRAGGSSGGHRGLASIIEALGTESFFRIRIGVGRGDGGRDLAGHVLGRLPPAEAALVDQAKRAAADAVAWWIRFGANEAMNRYNGWKAATPEGENRG